MIGRVLAIAAVELRIARRNRWALTAILLMLVFALALTFAGAGPTGALGVDLLTTSVASMTTLSVYLAPLLALLLSFDAITGEIERGSFALLLTYPVERVELLMGKLIAHSFVLSFATLIGFGAAGLAAASVGGAGAESIGALVRLIATTILLGWVFLAIGYAISALAGSNAGAAGAAVGVWLIFVVLYDIGLLGAVVLDQGGTFTTDVFPWLLVLNPADAFRLWNVAGSADVALATGLTGATGAIPDWAAPASLGGWSIFATCLAWLGLSRVTP